MNPSPAESRTTGLSLASAHRSHQHELHEAAHETAVDRALEQKLAELTSPLTGEIYADIAVVEKQSNAAAYLRERRHEPQVAYRLAEAMMSSPSVIVRSLAEYCLSGTEDSVGKDLLLAESYAKELCKGGGKFGTGPKNAPMVMEELRARREEPLVANRLLQILTDGSSGGYYAARILEGTPDAATQAKLKETLKTLLAEDARLERRDQYCVPLALRGSVDPEVQALLVDGLKNGHEFFSTNNFRSQCAAALATIDTPEAEKALKEIFYSPTEDWQMRRSTAEALKARLTPEIQQELKGLVDGSIWTTASALAGVRSSGSVGAFFTTLGLVMNNREELYDVRVQAAIALRDAEPALALKVMDEALKGKRDAFTHRCQFCAAGDALNYLRAAEKPAANAA